MELGLTDRVAIVTGGSRGIGLAIAEGLAAAGACVMLSSRKQPDLEAAAQRFSPDRVAVFAANAGDADAADACVAATLERFGRVDVLVNNAATNPYYGPSVDIDIARLSKTIDVNQKGPLWWIQSAWRRWMASNGGVVLNVTSAGGLHTAWGLGAYNMSKAALIHLTRQLAFELAPMVRVVSVAPGLVETDMSRAVLETRRAEMEAATPLARIGQPADIANLAVFLVSDAASWITGQTVLVDGGASTRPNRG